MTATEDSLMLVPATKVQTPISKKLIKGKWSPHNPNQTIHSHPFLATPNHQEMKKSIQTPSITPIRYPTLLNQASTENSSIGQRHRSSQIQAQNIWTWDARGRPHQIRSFRSLRPQKNPKNQKPLLHQSPPKEHQPQAKKYSPSITPIRNPD